MHARPIVLLALLGVALHPSDASSTLLANLDFAASTPPANRGGLQITDRLPFGLEARNHGMLLKTGGVAAALTSATLRAQCLNGNAVELVLAVSQLLDGGDRPGGQAPAPAPAGVEVLFYAGACTHAVSPATFSEFSLAPNDGDAPLWLAADAWHSLNVSCARGCGIYSTQDEAYGAWLTLTGTDTAYGWSAESDAGWAPWGNMAVDTNTSVFWLELQGTRAPPSPSPSPQRAASASASASASVGAGAGNAPGLSISAGAGVGIAAAALVAVSAAVAAAASLFARARARQGGGSGWSKAGKRAPLPALRARASARASALVTRGPAMA